MKQGTAGAPLPTAEMYGNEDHRLADLYTLELAAGTQRWTDADMAITVGAETWTPAAVLGQMRGRASLNLEASSVDVRFGSEILVGGVRLLARALDGELHDRRLLVQRAWIAATGAVAGLEVLFDGDVVEVTPQSAAVTVVAKSLTARMMAASIPAWPVQPSCPFQVYDPQCGVNPAGFTDPRSVGAGSTDTEVVLSAPSSRLTVGGWIVFKDGALAGRVETVLEVLVAGTRARVANPLPSAPSAGVQVDVVRGCDKTVATCGAVFLNKLRFGGAPYAPSEDMN